jgi:predicted transcriptional regulator YdeE
MPEYTYTDFSSALDETGRCIVEAVNDYITKCYPEYKPYDIRSNNSGEWMLNYRKKPKVGKALCSLYSTNSQLSMRVVFLGFMKNELLLRQHEFGEIVQRYILCDICKKCKANCTYEYRQYYYANGQFIASSIPHCINQEYTTEYAEISNVTKDDINDILKLIDLQSKYMAQDPRDTRGGGYMEENRKRCGDVEIVSFEKTKLDIDDFEKSEYANTKKLDKYTAVYYLTPMGEHEGLWYYHDCKSICEKEPDEYCNTVIPEGQYATVTINDPFSFSARRVWDYVAKWLWENNKSIRSVSLSGENVPYFVRFYHQDNNEYMTMYVPV